MPIHEVSYDFPIELLHEEFEQAFSYKQQIAKPDGYKFEGFFLLPPTDRAREIASKFIEYYNLPTINYIVNFLYLEPNASLPWHIDEQGSVSSLNVNISSSPEPIEFETGSFSYQTALIDTMKLHKVQNGSSPRKIYRITFQDEEATFENIKQIVQKHDQR